MFRKYLVHASKVGLCDQIRRNSTHLAMYLRFIWFWANYSIHFGTICMLLGTFSLLKRPIIENTSGHTACGENKDLRNPLQVLPVRIWVYLKVCLQDLDLLLRERRPHPLSLLLRMRFSFAVFFNFLKGKNVQIFYWKYGPLPATFFNLFSPFQIQIFSDPSFSLFVLSLQLTVYVPNQFCRWLNSNCGHQVMEATALPTELQPLPMFNAFIRKILIGADVINKIQRIATTQLWLDTSNHVTSFSHWKWSTYFRVE